MGILFTAAQRNITLTAAAQDVLSLRNGANTTLRVHNIRLTTQNNTDERIDLMLRIFTGSFTIGSGGTTVTPQPRDMQMNVNGDTVVSKITRFAHLDTTAAVVNTGAVSNFEADMWSELAPYEYLWTPEMRLKIPVSGLLVLNLALTNGFPAASRTCSYSVTWEED